jgi:hypothetical protein
VVELFEAVGDHGHRSGIDLVCCWEVQIIYCHFTRPKVIQLVQVNWVIGRALMLIIKLDSLFGVLRNKEYGEEGGCCLMIGFVAVC